MSLKETLSDTETLNKWQVYMTTLDLGEIADKLVTEIEAADDDNSARAIAMFALTAARLSGIGA